MDVTDVWLGDGVSADAEARALQWQRHQENVRLAARLGCRRYLVVDHIPKPADLPLSMTRPWLVDALRALGDVAAPLGVTVMV